MDIRLASDLSIDSIVDGPGLRCVLWTQGCPHNCQGCHNPQTHASYGGKIVDTEEVIHQIQNTELQSGLTISGGEPFMQCAALMEILKKIDKPNFTIWIYSGFTYEQIKADKRKYQLLKYVDVLIDGPFIESLKDYDLRFCGSSNQRIIDVQKTLKQDTVVLFEVE